MTAEIGVLNRNGVALAADSALTLGSPSDKIYQSANKLFQLSDHAPVGIMVYGAATLLNVPWETVIKLYRDKLGTKTYSSLKQYSQDFISFIRSNRRVFSEISQKDFMHAFAYNFFYDLYEISLPVYLERAFAQKGTGLTESEIRKVFLTCLRDELRSNLPD